MSAKISATVEEKRNILIPPGTDFNSDLEEAADDIFEEITGKPGLKEKPKARVSSFQILAKWFHGSLKRNEITGRIEYDGEPQSDQRLNSLFIELSIEFSQVKKHEFETFMNSDEVPSYNPLKNYLESYARRSTGHIEALVESLNFPVNKRLEEVGVGFTKKAITIFLRKWLVGMVASVYNNNYNCLMLVLIGPKGCGKTEFFRRLLPPELKSYFTQSKFTAGKDDEALMCEYLMILNDELDGLNTKEAKTFRNFISADHYSYRPPYGRQNVKRKRLATVCGASNDKDIINDPDNNRRVIPIEIFSVSHSLYNKVNKGDLINEAYRLYRDGFDWNLTENEMVYMDALSEGYEITSLETEVVQKYFSPENGTEQLTASEIKIIIEQASGQKLSLNKIGRALKSMQFECFFKKIYGKTTQVYVCNRTSAVYSNGKDG